MFNQTSKPVAYIYMYTFTVQVINQPKATEVGVEAHKNSSTTSTQRYTTKQREKDGLVTELMPFLGRKKHWRKNVFSISRAWWKTIVVCSINWCSYNSFAPIPWFTFLPLFYQLPFYFFIIYNSFLSESIIYPSVIISSRFTTF